MSVTLDRLRQERQQQIDFIAQTVDGASAGDQARDLSKTELESLNRAKDRIGELDAQIAPLAEFEALRDAANDTARKIVGGAPAPEARTGAAYTQNRDQFRDFGDFMSSTVLARQGDAAALQRMSLAGYELDGDALVVSRAAAPHVTTDELTGILPKTIRGPIESDIDAGRPFLTSVGVKPLGGIPGKVFSRPTITQHVQVGKQAAEKTELANRQLKIGGIDFTKATLGGWVNVSRQAIDWTSPSAWNALLADFQDEYAIASETEATSTFVPLVTQKQELTTGAGGTPTIQELINAIYGAAVKVYNGAKRMPTHLWLSIDQWAIYGAAIDVLKATTAGDGGGTSTVRAFMGAVLDLPKVVVPSLPAGTAILGNVTRWESYEERIGFVSAVEPKVFGVELAYGGDVANGMINAAGFVKIVNEA